MGNVMALQSNESGFIIGERRLKEMSDGINKTQDNTKQILDVLLESLKDLKQAVEASGDSIGEHIRRQRPTRPARDSSEPGQAPRRARNAGEDLGPSYRRSMPSSSPSPRTRTRPIDADWVPGAPSAPAGPGDSTGQPGTPNPNSAAGRAAAARERDANGRFIGADAGEETTAKRIVNGLKNIFGGGGISSQEARGLDPTIDAIGELSDTVAPVGRMFGRMTSRAAGLFSGRMRKRQNEELLPPQQVEANREQSRQNTRRNRLLERLIDAVRRNGGGRLGNLIGGRGMLGMLMGGGKALIKRIPLLGALFGGGMLAKDWGQLDSGEKGKGLGKIVGTAVGGILGSFLGPLGTVGGAAAGNYLGGIFGEKVGEWTDSLKSIDFGKIFENAVKDLTELKNKAGHTLMAPVRMAGRAYEGAKDYVREKVGGGGAGSQNMRANTKQRKERQLGMYKALRGAGFSHEQSLAIGGEIGRENDYGDAMFSTHIDPAKDKNGNNIKNGGVLSWNRARYEKFSKFMRDRGLMDAKGNMPKTQETMNAQAEFIKQEMNSKDYRGRLKDFLNNPNQDPKKAAEDLAKYIGWARGQTTVRGANGTRVPFDSKKHERKINGYIDLGAELVHQDQVKNGTVAKAVPVVPKKAVSPQIFKPGVSRPSPVPVPKVSPELTKIGTAAKSAVKSAPSSDPSMGQNVSDRNLAHIMSGGLGFRG